MYLLAPGQEEIRDPLAGIGLVGMFRLRQSVEEERQIEAVVQLFNVHLGEIREEVTPLAGQR